MITIRNLGYLICAVLTVFIVGCGDDENAANKAGVGAQCMNNDDCVEENQQCLTQFKGGYCGVQNCTAHADCPAGSACVTHEDQKNYCFLICAEKVDCNVNRTVDNESNCSANVTFVENTTAKKACVPPTGN